MKSNFLVLMAETLSLSATPSLSLQGAIYSFWRYLISSLIPARDCRHETHDRVLDVVPEDRAAIQSPMFSMERRTTLRLRITSQELFRASPHDLCDLGDILLTMVVLALRPSVSHHLLQSTCGSYDIDSNVCSSVRTSFGFIHLNISDKLGSSSACSKFLRSTSRFYRFTFIRIDFGSWCLSTREKGPQPTAHGPLLNGNRELSPTHCITRRLPQKSDGGPARLPIAVTPYGSR